jgi:prolyl-tRNA synthetase
MKFTKLFSKTKKDSKEYESRNATLLIKAGYVDQLMAGVYTYLTLGKRVITKIERIVREEMDAVANEIYMPSLSPKEIWETSKRLETVDVLMKTSGANDASKQRNDSEYILNPTHEDVVTPLAKKFHQSYKELPFAVYQIQSKFRNEARVKSGLLRGREFIMKDLYSFHESNESLMEYYEVMKDVYTRVFERVGLGEMTHLTLASGGDFTKNNSHEFQTECAAGEDLVFHDAVNNIYYNREVTASQAPKVIQENKEMIPRDDVLGKGMIGVEDLAKFLNISVELTTKTLIFVEGESQFVAAAVRGNYSVDEDKLKKILDTTKLRMATPEEIKQLTGADVGYAGILDLPDEVRIIIDESCADRVNFECGANKTDYHSLNVNWGRDLPLPEKFYDIKVAQEGDLCPATGQAYKVFKAAEVGNIFPLETKFSIAFDYTYLNDKGESLPVFMGSYGIGISRLMGVVAEVFNDEKGLIWPSQIAPYQVHLVTFDQQIEGEAFTASRQLYEQLTKEGTEVIWDDRMEVTIGEKLADADLLGMPVRVLVSKRSLEAGGVEIKHRNSEEVKVVSVAELLAGLK